MDYINYYYYNYYYIIIIINCEIDWINVSNKKLIEIKEEVLFLNRFAVQALGIS